MLNLNDNNWCKYFGTVITFASIHYTAQRVGIKVNKVYSTKYDMCLINSYTLADVIEILRLKEVRLLKYPHLRHRLPAIRKDVQIAKELVDEN